MAYSAEVVRKARDLLAQEKEDRESQNRERLANAYRQVPRLRQIDIALRSTMAQAAQAAFSQGSADGRELLSQAREKNLALQREREALIAENLPEGYLDERPICQRCGGTGYLGSNMCDCLEERCRREQQKIVSVLSGNQDNFGSFRLDYYSDVVDPKFGASPRTIMAGNLQTCRRYAMTVTQTEGGNLLFVGGTGLGKTFLSACIARTVTERGYSVAYESSGHLFSMLEQAKFGGDEESRRSARYFSQCDLLILDDLGTEVPGQFVTASLYTLLNDRIMAGKPMVVSTNLTIEDLKKRYTPQIVSRLRGSFTMLTFVGEDIRVMMNRGIG